MEKIKFSYSDSVAGMQSETFNNLSEIVSYIEKFGYNGDSEGIIYQNDEQILMYISREDGIIWSSL